ncbi:MAG: helix-turn-helix transcriptional regulator [Sphingobacteriales bacterium]|nr:helix-turn-helix transcriptional regulator [Sphingobacteriales bacterium]
MLTVHLEPIFKARGIDNPYYFLTQEGFTPQTAKKIANGTSPTLKMKHIEMLCAALYCTPNELFLYKPDKKNKLSDTHPLNTLTGELIDFKLKETLTQLPIAQLKEIAGIISKTGQQPPKEQSSL